MFDLFVQCIGSNPVCKARLVRSLVRLYVDVSYAEGAAEVCCFSVH